MLLTSKRKAGVLAVVFLGMAAMLFFQEQQVKRLIDENTDLRAQLNQMLRVGNGHSADELKATLERSQASQNEVTRLRGQAVRLHQIERENAELKAQRQQLERQLEQQRRRGQNGQQPRPQAQADLNPSRVGFRRDGRRSRGEQTEVPRVLAASGGPLQKLPRKRGF